MILKQTKRKHNKEPYERTCQSNNYSWFDVIKYGSKKKCISIALVEQT